MGFPRLAVGDLVLVTQYSGEESIEICQYRGVTGNLMLMIHHPEIILTSQTERFIRDVDRMPYSVRIIRKSDSAAWTKAMLLTKGEMTT